MGICVRLYAHMVGVPETNADQILLEITLNSAHSLYSIIYSSRVIPHRDRIFKNGIVIPRDASARDNFKFRLINNNRIVFRGGGSTDGAMGNQTLFKRSLGDPVARLETCIGRK